MCTAEITTDTIVLATEQLGRSERGRQAMASLLRCLEEDGWLGLDGNNTEAIYTLLLAAWGSSPGTACDAIRAAVGKEESTR